MTREEIYKNCVEKIAKTNCLLLESATGTGKSKVSIDLTNHIISMKPHRPVSMLILVAKRVHKQTWNEEIQKWGGIKADTVRMECYESMHKCLNEYYDIIIADECHHIGSDQRLELMKYLKFGWFIGLSATIPNKLKISFKYRYHAEIVSCNIIEAIEDEVLPEPTILLFPLQLENIRMSEVIELNPKGKGTVVHGEYKNYWKLKKSRQHAIIRCTQKQKLMILDKDIDWYKQKAMSNPAMKQTWLYLCGRRLEFLADFKLNWVKLILQHLDKQRTITFCKTISQTEQLGSNCIHSKNKEAEEIYNAFNQGKIDHITAVNILNENANLVNCRYAIFCNLSSSDVVVPQRIGRSLRHKDPVIIIPYYKETREEKLVSKAIEGFTKIKTIHSINEI